MLSLFGGLSLARERREEGSFHAQVNIASLNVLVGRVLLKQSSLTTWVKSSDSVSKHCFL